MEVNITKTNNIHYQLYCDQEDIFSVRCQLQFILSIFNQLILPCIFSMVYTIVEASNVDVVTIPYSRTI